MNKLLQCHCLLPLNPVMSLIKISDLIKSCCVTETCHLQWSTPAAYKKKREAWENLWHQSDGYTSQKKQNNEALVWDKEQNNPTALVTSTNSWAKVSNTLLPRQHHTERGRTQKLENQLPPTPKKKSVYKVWGLSCVAFTSQNEDLACCRSSSSQEWTQRDAIIQLHLKSCCPWTPTSKM